MKRTPFPRKARRWPAKRTVVKPAINNPCPNCGRSQTSMVGTEVVCSYCGYAVLLGWHDGVYQSKLEARRSVVLRQLRAAGFLSDLQEQVAVPMPYLNRYGKWTADFAYVEDGRQIYEDVKGAELPTFKVLLRLWPDYGPGVLRVAKAGRNKAWKVRDHLGAKGGDAK